MTRSGAPDRDDAARVARLLAAAHTPPRRPVDLLLEDLAAHGPGRFEELLRTGPAAGLRPDAAVSRADLVRAQRACRSRTPASVRQRLEDLAGYFACLALALDRHGVSLTRQPAGRVEAALLDLAARLGGDWSGVFERAAARTVEAGA